MFELFNFGKTKFSLLIKRCTNFKGWKEENFVSKLFKYIPNIKLLIDLNNGAYLLDFLFLKKCAHFFKEKENLEYSIYLN